MTTWTMKLDALTLFDQAPELSTREVARRIGMPPATAARLRAAAGKPSPFRPFGAP